MKGARSLFITALVGLCSLAVGSLVVGGVAGCGPRRVDWRSGQPGQSSASGRANVPPPPRGADWAWSEVRPTDTGFACRMPVQPRYGQRVGRERDGAFFRSVDARAQVPYGSFAVIVTEWEGGLVGDPLEAAASAADDIFEREQLQRRRSERLDIPGFYGREDTGVAQNGAFVALRQFVGRSRIYVAVAIVASSPGPLSTAEAFMGSIRLDGRDALLPSAASGAEPSPLFLPETDFAVRMPPITSRRTEDVAFGESTLVSHTFFSDAGSTRFRVRVFDVPGRMEATTGSRLATQLDLGEPGAALSTSGFPGLTYRRTTGNVSIEARLFVTAARIYVIEAATQGGPSDTPAIRAFFDSFRIL